MIRAEVGDARMAKFDANTEAHSLQKVTVEFDVLSECSLEVLADVLRYIDSVLTRPRRLGIGPFFDNPVSSDWVNQAHSS